MSSMKQRNEIITQMMTDKSLFQAVKKEDFKKEIDEMFVIASDDKDAVQQLLAIGAITRIAFFIKALREPFFERLQPVFESPIPSLQILDEADDRLYVAKAFEYITPVDWLPSYLASELFLEEKGEKTRSSVVTDLVSRSNDLNDILSLCVSSIERFKAQSSDLSADQIIKRYTLAFKALRKAIATADITSHEQSGESFKQLLITATRGASGVKDSKIQFAFAEEVIAFIHSLVQVRFSLATDALTYSALSHLKSWLGKTAWLVFLSKSKNITVIRSDLSEAVLILAKQGITDADLLDVLKLTFPSRDRAKSLLKKVANSSESIPSEVKTWLMSAGTKTGQKNDKQTDDSLLLNADQSIALLLLDALRFEQIVSNTEHNITSSVDMFDPALSSQTQTLFVRGRSVLNNVKSLAVKRGLQTRGNSGDVVEYSPLEHQLINGNSLGVRKVKIITPLVEKVIRNNVSTVLQAQVEALD